jgi:uroporphyrinogen-III decarboxylase
MTGLATDSCKAHALLDRLTEASVTWTAAQARHGVDAVLISSAFAGGSFISRTACSVSPHVEPWKLELLTELAEGCRYG